MLHFFKKIKKNTCRYHYQNLDDMIYSSWDIEQNKLKLLILGHFLPFYPPKNLKNQNFEKCKNLLKISLFYTCTKNHNHMMYGSWDMECDRQNFFVIMDCFLPFYFPMDPENQNLEKKKKNPGRYHHFTTVYQKSWSYAALLLRYGAWQM